LINYLTYSENNIDLSDLYYKILKELGADIYFQYSSAEHFFIYENYFVILTKQYPESLKPAFINRLTQLKIRVDEIEPETICFWDPRKKDYIKIYFLCDLLTVNTPQEIKESILNLNLLSFNNPTIHSFQDLTVDNDDGLWSPVVSIKATDSSLMNKPFSYLISQRRVDSSPQLHFVQYKFPIYKHLFRQELIKVFLTPKPSIVFNTWLKSGILEIFLPEVFDCVTCQQDERWHNDNVYDHTMKALDESFRFIDDTKNFVMLRMAILCHDIGKVPTRKEV